jgi:hypothetical protein
MPMKDSYFGKAPNVFIGRHGYPHIRVGILGTENYRNHDDPALWSASDTKIPEILQLRSQLVNSHFRTSIKGFADRFADIAKEISLVKRPVDVEINLKDRPRFKLSFEQDVAPHGPSVALQKATITENAAVDTRVDKVASALDLSAAEGITTLAKKGIDGYFLTKAFSMGNFGLALERKLVPTKWSITAVDDIIGKRHIDEIKKCLETDCVAHFGGHLGNYFLVLFFDDVWQYELFEQFWPNNKTPPIAETDYEAYEGRKSYVDETAGGYYASRIAVLEHLVARKRQSSVLVIRIITEEYSAPLGVWVVREAVRKALTSEPIHFADRNLMKQYAKSFLHMRFGYDVEQLFTRSKLLTVLWKQKKLSSYA